MKADAFQGNSSTVPEAMESLATNILSCGVSTEGKASSDSDDELPLFEAIDQEDFSAR